MTGEEIVAALERSILVTEAELAARIESDKRTYGRLDWTDITPAQVRDNNGRFILLDAYIALAQAKAVFG